MLTPSLTVMVMVAEPTSPAAGVIFTVRLLPAPPKTILLNGTRRRFEELPRKLRFPTGLSGSLMLKSMVGVGVFTTVVWLGIELSVGAAPVVDAGLTFRLQPSAKLPSSPAPSSDTYSDQVQLADCLLNADNTLANGPTGAGNSSPGL